MISRRRLSSLLFLLLSLAWGCVRALPPPRAPIGAEAQRALDLLVAQWTSFSDLRTLANILLEHRGERRQLTGVLLVKAPASVRLEALSPLGQPLLLVTVHEGQLVAYNVVSNEALVGPATAETAGRLLNLPFEPGDLVAVLAGLVARPKDLRVAEVLAADSDGPSLHLIGADHRQRVWMDFKTGVVRQVEITGGRIAVRITYERAADGSVSGFALDAAQSYVTGTFHYRDPVLNGGIDPERFQLAIPPGAKLEQLR